MAGFMQAGDIASFEVHVERVGPRRVTDASTSAKIFRNTWNNARRNPKSLTRL